MSEKSKIIDDPVRTTFGTLPTRKSPLTGPTNFSLPKSSDGIVVGHTGWCEDSPLWKAALEAAPLKPHPIVKLGAELAAEFTPAELEARRELRYLARRWQTKLRPPLLVANKLRQQGALWRLRGVGTC